MLAGVVVLGLLAVVWLFSQETSTADAPGHCDAQTEGYGMRLSYEELVSLAYQAGFGDDSRTAAAIAIAESNEPPTNPPTGNTQAYNPEKNAAIGYEDAPDGEGSYGLWQIYLHKHPEFSGQDLYDENVNASAAYKVYSDAGGFKPWSTYKSGKYQEYLNA